MTQAHLSTNELVDFHPVGPTVGLGNRGAVAAGAALAPAVAGRAPGMRLGRRTMLGLSMGLAPALLLPGGPHGGAWAASPASYHLVPAWQANWALHRTRPEEVARIEQLPAGVEAITGRYTELAEGLALWAKTPVSGDFRAMFHYTRTDMETVTTGNGIFTQFFWGMLGEGSPDWPEDVSAWDAYTEAEPVADDTYADHARGIRISFNTFNTTTTGSDRVRARYFRLDGSRANLPPDGGVLLPFPFPVGEKRKVTLTRAGSTFTFAMEAPDGTVTRQSFTHQVVAEFLGGWIGFRVSAGRHCRIEGLVLLDD